MTTTTTHPQPRRRLYAVSVVTHNGVHVSDQVQAYDADDAKTKTRNMLRANHGETHLTFTSVTPA